MKTRLNIAINDELLQRANEYASKRDTSLSRLVEEYFMSLTLPAENKSMLDVITGLPKPKIKNPANIKDKYYRERKGKYGF